MPLCSYIRQQEDNRQAIFAESITLSIDGPESREEKSDANPYDFTWSPLSEPNDGEGDSRSSNEPDTPKPKQQMFLSPVSGQL